jgi:hypothetical protein
MYIMCAAESRVLGGVLVIFASQVMFRNLSNYFLPAPSYETPQAALKKVYRFSRRSVLYESLNVANNTSSESAFHRAAK